MQSIDDFFHGLPIPVEQVGDEHQVNRIAFVADARLCDPRDRRQETTHRNRRRQLQAMEDGRQMFFFRVEEWEICPGIIQDWIAHKLGLAKPYCSARQCRKVVIGHEQAQSFYRDHHLQADVGGQHFGLVYQDEVVAVLTLSRCSQSRKGATGDGEYVLARYAVKGSIPGAASRLFRFAVKTVDAIKVTTFSDHSYATGALYPMLGFRPVGESPPDYRVWHPELGIMHKSAWRRKNIPRRITDLGAEGTFLPETDPRTESQMESELGCSLIWDCGKTRWEAGPFSGF